VTLHSGAKGGVLAGGQLGYFYGENKIGLEAGIGVTSPRLSPYVQATKTVYEISIRELFRRMNFFNPPPVGDPYEDFSPVYSGFGQLLRQPADSGGRYGSGSWGGPPSGGK
jgi:hypothetical protein